MTKIAFASVVKVTVFSLFEQVFLAGLYILPDDGSTLIIVELWNNFEIQNRRQKVHNRTLDHLFKVRRARMKCS